MFDGTTGDQFYTTEKLGTSQELTPEGFLLCRNVPVARTGSQDYAPGEVPIEPGPNGLIRITRDEADVFHPVTLASYQGKPLVDEHPTEKVTPDTWRNHALGVVLNARRGDGIMFDNAFTFADFLVTDRDAIAAVRGGKRQVSVGYDADYEPIGPGQGRQHNIIVNHVALVDRGRCGPRCAIGDSEMASRGMRAFKDRIRRAVRTRDEAGVLNAVAELSKDPELLGEVLSGDESLEEGGFPSPPEDRGSSGSHHVTINVHGGKADTVDEPDVPAAPETGAAPAPGAAAPEGGGVTLESLASRLDQFEQVLAAVVEALQGGEGGGEEQPAEPEQPEANYEPAEGGGDGMARDHAMRRRAAVGDSSSMQGAFQLMLSQAEIIMPGIGLMTFDSAAPAKTTFDAMCNFKRKTLEAAMKNPERVGVIKTVMGDRLPATFVDKSVMTCDQVGIVFNSAAAIASQENRGRAFQPHFGNNGQENGFSKAPLSAAELNAKNAEFYAKQSMH